MRQRASFHSCLECMLGYLLFWILIEIKKEWIRKGKEKGYWRYINSNSHESSEKEWFNFVAMVFLNFGIVMLELNICDISLKSFFDLWSSKSQFNSSKKSSVLGSITSDYKIRSSRELRLSFYLFFGHGILLILFVDYCSDMVDFCFLEVGDFFLV